MHNKLFVCKFFVKNCQYPHKKYGIILHRFMYTTVFCVPVFSILINFSTMAYKWATATIASNRRTTMSDVISNIFRNSATPMVQNRNPFQELCTILIQSKYIFDPAMFWRNFGILHCCQKRVPSAKKKQ